MAVYKVPQDVEAEDKLIGPFGFRQFVYLIVAALGILLGYVLFRVFPFLAIIPLPMVALFIIISLPLRKEQPMETYLIALLRFFLKPRQRKWESDGVQSYVEILAPKIVEEVHLKEMSSDEAVSKLDYLARVMDTQGWAAKGLDSAAAASLTDEVAQEAANTSDIMDDHAELAKSFDSLIAEKNRQTRQEAMERLQHPRQAPPKPERPLPSRTVAQQPKSQEELPHLRYDPYPQDMHQRVLSPEGQQASAPQAAPVTNEPPQQQTQPQPVVSDVSAQPQTGMTQSVSPDIINLANNDDLSVSAIAHEAHRLTGDSEEVVIQLH